MIFLTDLHLDEFRQFSTMQEGVNTRLIDQIWLVGELTKIIEETNTRNVLFLGDMFNSLSYALPKNVYQAAYYFVKSISQKAALYLLVGNHDLHMGRHLFGLYENMPNVKVISKPLLKYHLEDYTIDMIPYGYQLPKKGHMADILIGHLEVKGSVMNASGIKTPEGISDDELEGYKYVFLGHYHEYQRLQVLSAEWAGYIGSVMQIDLGSSPYPKGLVLFDKGKVKHIQLNAPQIHHEIVTNQEEADTLISKVWSSHDYWRITVKEPGIKLPNFNHHVQLEYDIQPKLEIRLEDKPGEDLSDTVVRFIGITDTKIDKALATELAREMMK